MITKESNDDEYSRLVSSLLARTGGWMQLPNLKKELESWRPFWAALRKEDQLVFQGVIASIWDYAAAIEYSSKDETMNSTEAFLLSIILAQQKKILAFSAESRRLQQ